MNKKKKNIDKDLPGYKPYPPEEDIYFNEQKEDLELPKGTHKTKISSKDNLKPEMDYKTDLTGEDLDVPGSELDDEQEEIGNEDEENNYYSLGSDKD